MWKSCVFCVIFNKIFYIKFIYFYYIYKQAFLFYTIAGKNGLDFATESARIIIKKSLFAVDKNVFVLYNKSVKEFTHKNC